MRFASILRGINVGGHRKILMKDLVALYSNLGFLNIKTYIQSGNVVFDSELDSSTLETIIQAEIEKVFGIDVPVIIRNHTELLKIIESNPYSELTASNSDKLYITFLKTKPDSSRVDSIDRISFDHDVFKIIDSEIFILFEDKASNSKLTNNFFESKLKVTCTSRNWNTVMKILEML